MRHEGNILLEYFRLQRSNISHYLRLCVEGTEAESVHRLRVSIKKVRTVYKLAGILLPSESKEHRKELVRLRKLFRLAGAIRDAQVIHRLVSRYEAGHGVAYSEFKSYIRDLEQRSVVKFFRGLETLQNELDSLPAGLRLENSLQHIPYAEISAYLGRLLEKRYKKVRKIVQSEPDEKGLHEARMLLKQMRYLMSVARKRDPHFQAFDLSLTNLKATESLLGQWHDQIILLERLEAFTRTSASHNKPVKKRYHGLASKVNTHRRQLTHQIHESFSEYFRVHFT